jgi:hypothetical protein
MKTVTGISSFVICAISFFAACSKGDDASGLSAKRLLMIEASNSAGQGLTTFDYNTDGTLSEILYSTRIGCNPYYNQKDSFTYKNGRLVERSINLNKYLFFYNGDTLVKAEIREGNITRETDLFTYKDGRCTRWDRYNHSLSGIKPATPTGRFDYEYYSTGNLKKTTEYFTPLGGPLVKAIDVLHDEYDNKINPLKMSARFPFLPMTLLSPNNVTKETTLDSNGAVTQIVTYLFTYDTNGNPLTRQTIASAGGTQWISMNEVFKY